MYWKNDEFIENLVFSSKVGLFSAPIFQKRPILAFLRKVGLVWQLCKIKIIENSFMLLSIGAAHKNPCSACFILFQKNKCWIKTMIRNGSRISKLINVESKNSGLIFICLINIFFSKPELWRSLNFCLFFSWTSSALLNVSSKLCLLISCSSISTSRFSNLVSYLWISSVSCLNK